MAASLLATTVGTAVITPTRAADETCTAAPFPDVPADHPFCLEITWMAEEGISTGFDDGTYRPAANVTRQAMSAFMARLDDATLADCNEPPFADVPMAHPFCREIRWMGDSGVSMGFDDGTYRPSAVVTRQAMSAFMARLAGAMLAPCAEPPFSDVPADHPFCREISWMKQSGVSLGFNDGTYRPSAVVTRQAMSAFMHRVSDLLAVLPITELEGEPASPATAAIPDLTFGFKADDYAPHPGMGGLAVSFDVLYLVFELDTTVEQANALLTAIDAEIIGGRPGVAEGFEGILLVRVPTSSHAEMDALVDSLNADPRVRVAVQESLLEPLEIPEGREAPAMWIWGSEPFGDNWGLEAIRVPQMWNLNRSVMKSGSPTSTGVFDGGFYDHRDLSYDTRLTDLGAGPEVDHGTHVAGTIAAGYNDGFGIDGITPYAALVVDAYDIEKGGWGLYEFIERAPDVAVVNVSLGENWYQHPPLNDAEALEAHEMIMGQAVIFELWQIGMLATGRRLPLIVAAAGNDSNTQAFARDIDARWSSPWNYAALVDGVDNVIVVEAVGLQLDGTMARASFSNINGQISAPGVDICSTATRRLRDPEWPDQSCGDEVTDAPFMLKSGTSMAAPHVTGLASYLLSIDPHLTPQQLRKLLIENGVAAAGTASPRIDAFASAMAIDGIRNDSKVLRRLLDIDDGTVDGNLRLDCRTTCADFREEDADLDGGRGDGRIDMSDFRRWRDWHLIATDYPGLELDGSATNPKMDVNHDNFFGQGLFEDVYPDGDFNGDGTLNLTKTKFVPGHINASVTDLEALQILFDDPDYSAAELNGLVESVDIHVDPSACLGAGIVGVQTKIFETTDMIWVDDRFDRDGASHEYTMPFREGGYTVRVEALDDYGNTAGVAQASFAAPLGSDSWFRPSSCGRITISPTWVNVVLDAGESTTETAHLVSSGLDANWEFTSSIVGITPVISGGSIGAGADVAIDLTFTCPASPRTTGGVLNLKFTDARGAAITEAVPEYLAADLECLEGGVEVQPEILEMAGRPGQEVTGSFALVNKGSALLYQTSPGAHLAIEDPDEADGELPLQDTVYVTVTATCPEVEGNYSTSVGLSFEREDGKPVTVQVPDSAPVVLTCEWVAPFRWFRQLHGNQVSLDWPAQQVQNLFDSYPETGTGTYRNQENHHQLPDEEVEWNGWGSQFSRINLSDSFDFCNSCPDPQTRTRSASSIRNFEATVSGPTPTVTFSGDVSQQYTQSRKLPENKDVVSLSTTITFDLLAEAQLDATWECVGFCSVNLHGCDACGWIFMGNTTGSFSGMLPPGRYAVFVHSFLATNGDALSFSAQSNYRFEFTFPE